MKNSDIALLIGGVPNCDYCKKDAKIQIKLECESDPICLCKTCFINIFEIGWHSSQFKEYLNSLFNPR